MPKQPTWVLIAFIATLVFGFLLFTRVYSNCSADAPGWTPCAFYDVAKDFKEVFGWIVAVCAAYLAAKPVWKQLDLMRVDVDISSIKFLEQEIEALKRLRVDVGTALTPLTDYIQNRSRNDEDKTWNGNVHAAHEAAKQADHALSRIEELNVAFEISMGEASTNMLQALSKLQSCFFDMNSVYYRESFPEIYTDADVEKARQIENEAASQIDARIADLNAARSGFEAGITSAIEARIRLISEKKTAMVSPR